MSDIRSRGDGKRGIPSYIQQYSSPNENFEYDHLHSDALLYIRLKLECYKPHKASCHPTKCDVINDAKLFPTLYYRIYYRKFMTISIQMLRYKIKYIKIVAVIVCVFFFFIKNPYFVLAVLSIMQIILIAGCFTLIEIWHVISYNVIF